MRTILEAFMERHEKRITQLPPIRCDEALLAGLNRLAAMDDRKLTDYMRLVLERHVYGHGSMLPADEAAHQ